VDVVHAAAAVGVAQSLCRVEHFVDVSVRGTATLLDCEDGRQSRDFVPFNDTGKR
jgi:hypothetical protein